MIAKNVTIQDLEQTLRLVNKIYDNNVTFNRLEQYGKRVRFTLRVKDSKGKGARRGHTGRRLINACWHVHGDFFDILFKINPRAVIRSAGREITKDYGNWEDWNIGSIINPLYYSEACECWRWRDEQEINKIKEMVK